MRHRAWTPGFSSALITKSLSPNASPSHNRSYRSSTLAALTAKYGSRGKIHDRCCQGLIASAASQRRTVDADTRSQIPRPMTSRASSGQLHRASAAPARAGSSQARALTSATTAAGKTRGLPLRGRSARPGRPSRQNRLRHLRTVSSVTANLRAVTALGSPSAAASTIRARST
jgi:hypothetical protein